MRSTAMSATVQKPSIRKENDSQNCKDKHKTSGTDNNHPHRATTGHSTPSFPSSDLTDGAGTRQQVRNSWDFPSFLVPCCSRFFTSTLTNPKFDCCFSTNTHQSNIRAFTSEVVLAKTPNISVYLGINLHPVDSPRPQYSALSQQEVVTERNLRPFS
ncbi:uncharacterized protein LOC134476457 isoform X2 [Cavia porcellus]|uniref:uncharacterized protein LOC134476457 isoform X2 n=1 Tax=Cavia porcellus TaxID=10141 RepID=UPI002FDF73AF